MLRWLIDTSLRLRVPVAVLAALLLIAGVPRVRNIPIDVFPEFAPPLVEVQTEAPGLSPEQVESLVTVPIENALNGTSWLATLRSKSVLGLSSVVLIFEPGTDLMRARQLVQERLTIAASRLPTVARPPVLLSPLSSTSRVLKVGLSSRSLSLMELSSLARWTIRPRLLAVPGVANVAIWGQRDRQIHALVDPARLHAHGVTLNDVILAARDGAELSTGGFIDTPNQRLAVTHVSAVRGADDLARVPVAFPGGSALLLGDVADIVDGHPPLIGEGVINDGAGLLLIVEKQPWGNTLEVTRQVEAALAAMAPGLEGVEIDSTIFRPATFIEMSIANLNRTLLIGAILVVIILIAFLYEWRTAVISALAIPLSLVSALLVLHARGGTIDTMVLAGLVIALGAVVDDAIVDVENIVRRLNLNRSRPTPLPAFQVVLSASLEVRSAVVLASGIIALVLVPVFFLPGLAGTFFRPLAASYILAILASLVVALTVTPALALLLLPGAPVGRGQSPLVRALKSRYRRLLPTLLAQQRRAAPVIAGVLVLTLLILPVLGQELLPQFKEYDFLMHWVEKPGTSIDAMRRITIRASHELRSVPGVRNFGAHIGRAEVADEIVGPNFTELWISLDPEVDYDASVSLIQEIVDGYPGLHRDLLTYLKERIKEVLTGTSASIVVRIYGPELDGLRQASAEVATVMGDVPGIRDLKVEPQVLVPHLQVAIRPERALQFGLTPGEVRRAATTLVQGTRVGEIYAEQQVFDVVVWGRPEIRTDVAALRDLRIDTPGSGQVPLGAVADVAVTSTPNVIKREGASRRIDVTANVQGRDLASVAREVEKAVGTLRFELGYHPEFLGEYAELAAARRQLISVGFAVLIGIFLILHADLASLALALLVFATLPFAMVGGVFAALLSGGVLSLGSLVGFVTVLGIAARNAILMVSHWRHLENEEGMPFGRDLVMRGAEERLAPILMTALTTALALTPIALGGNLPGQEIEHPMAIVILGGLVTSTLLNLLLLPALYLRYGRRNQEST